MIEITSAANPAVKAAKALKNRKDREEKQLFCIEGARFVEEALRSGARPVSVFTSEHFGDYGGRLAGMIEESGCKHYSVPEKLFKEISDTETPQGILAVIPIKKHELTPGTIEAAKNRLYVVLDSVRDPGNMGTIIRTADAAGFSGVIAARGCVDIYNPKVLRSTMGSVFHIPVYTGLDIIDIINLLKKNNIRIFATHLKAEESLFKVDISCDAALVVGNEAEGIGSNTAGAADRLVRIPMPGLAESLNASAAAAIMIFESVRQREAKNML